MPLFNARDLTDLQWAVLEVLIPEPPGHKDRRGRPEESTEPTTTASTFNSRAIWGSDSFDCL
jgi:transposase